jgi:spore germination protein KB
MNREMGMKLCMKISTYQMFWLISISYMLMITYLPIKLAVEEAHQDAWISILLAGLIMIGISWMMLRLCMQHKEKTLVSFIKDIIGTVLGKVIVTLYFLVWFMQLTTIAKGMVDFQNLVLLPKTPMSVILLCMLFLVAYVVCKGGITAISRCAEMIGPFFVVTLFVELFFNPHDMNMKRLLPIYADSGWLLILKGTLDSISFMADPSIILMLFFFAQNQLAAARSIFWATAVSMFWAVLTTLILISVAGPDMASEWIFPVYSLTKIISILNFIQNIDAFFLFLWLLGAFIKLSVCLFILSYGLSEWTGFKSWKIIACLCTIGWFGFVIYSEHTIWISYTQRNVLLTEVFYPFVYFIVPFILWGISSLRRIRENKRVGHNRA